MINNECVRVREECMGYNGDGGCSSCFWGFRLEKGGVLVVIVPWLKIVRLSNR